MIIEGAWSETEVAIPVSMTPLDHWIYPKSTEGSAFVAEADRYHLYISLACPFAHRAYAVYCLLGLEDVIGLTIVSDIKLNEGWELDEDNKDPISATRLHQVYTAFDPNVTTRASVPLLVDLKTKQIVSNDSTQIAKMLALSFGASSSNALNLYPTHLHDGIDDLNEWIHKHINLGVYNVGFSTEQAGYDVAVKKLFDSLDELDERLAAGQFLHGDQITLSDIWLFATLARFDPVYSPLFKCSIRRITDYQNLGGYLRGLMSSDCLAASVNMPRIKRHYYLSLLHTANGTIDLNPNKLIPADPAQDQTVSGDRKFLNHQTQTPKEELQ